MQRIANHRENDPRWDEALGLVGRSKLSLPTSPKGLNIVLRYGDRLVRWAPTLEKEAGYKSRETGKLKYHGPLHIWAAGEHIPRSREITA